MELEMETFASDRKNLRYIRSGKGKPLVLIHGYPLDHTIWNKVVPLLEQKFDLIIPDLQGFGESDIGKIEPSMIDYARDIERLLNHLKIKKAFLGGHSMGGYVMLAFTKEFPQRVSGLAMISTQSVADSQERKKARRANAEQVEKMGIGVVLDSMVPKLSKDPLVQEYVRQVITRQKPKGIINALIAMANRPDSTELLKSLKIPVVIVHGNGDELIPIDRAREMKTDLPTASYSELVGVGHMPMIENPKAIANVLDQLLNL
jgi:3-oxoadipate enol-lactonase